MSGYLRVPRWVVDQPELDRTDLAVYIALSYFVENKENVCNPTVGELTGIARCGKKHTVFRAIKNLEEAGCIEVDRRAGFPSVYHLPKSK